MKPTRYRIVPLDPAAHLFEVACTVADPAPEGQRLRLPTWIPGSYLVREFARSFVSVRAECAGASVAIAKEAKDTWRAQPCAGPLTVIAEVYAFDLSVRTAYLDNSRGYFNGPSVFLCPEGREQEPCEIEIVAPPHARAPWRVATTLPRDGAPAWGFGRYRASSYDELIDHPVELGEFSLASFEAGGVPHDVAVTGRAPFDAERLTQDLARICQWQVDLFGGSPGSRAPFDRYLFQVMAVGDGYGGLEHRQSTSLLCSRRDLPAIGAGEASDEYRGFLGLASHEYFHAWNVKRIKPAAFVPYDLSREAYTGQLWAFEGITSYYDDLALRRSGVIDVASYLELLGRGISNVLRSPGRQRQSLAQSSFDAWIKFYRPDENSPNAVVSYYAKGAIVALALDLTLRLTGRTTLDDVMRALWKRHGETGRGVPEDGVERVASELAGESLRPFFAAYVEGVDDPPLEPLLASFGLRYRVRPAEGAKDRGGTAGRRKGGKRCTLGARANADLKLVHVVPQGPASSAGLSAGDVIVAIDGLKASTDAIEALYAHGKAGDTHRVHAFRRDELIEAEVVLAEAADDTAWITVDEAADDGAKARRIAWLGA